MQTKVEGILAKYKRGLPALRAGHAQDSKGVEDLSAGSSGEPAGMDCPWMSVLMVIGCLEWPGGEEVPIAQGTGQESFLQGR